MNVAMSSGHTDITEEQFYVPVDDKYIDEDYW